MSTKIVSTTDQGARAKRDGILALEDNAGQTSRLASISYRLDENDNLRDTLKNLQIQGVNHRTTIVGVG